MEPCQARTKATTDVVGRAGSFGRMESVSLSAVQTATALNLARAQLVASWALLLQHGRERDAAVAGVFGYSVCKHSLPLIKQELGVQSFTPGSVLDALEKWDASKPWQVLVHGVSAVGTTPGAVCRVMRRLFTAACDASTSLSLSSASSKLSRLRVPSIRDHDAGGTGDTNTTTTRQQIWRDITELRVHRQACISDIHNSESSNVVKHLNADIAGTNRLFAVIEKLQAENPGDQFRCRPHEQVSDAMDDQELAYRGAWGPLLPLARCSFWSTLSFAMLYKAAYEELKAHVTALGPLVEDVQRVLSPDLAHINTGDFKFDTLTHMQRLAVVEHSISAWHMRAWATWVVAQLMVRAYEEHCARPGCDGVPDIYLLAESWAECVSVVYNCQYHEYVQMMHNLVDLSATSPGHISSSNGGDDIAPHLAATSCWVSVSHANGNDGSHVVIERPVDGDAALHSDRPFLGTSGSVAYGPKYCYCLSCSPVDWFGRDYRRYLFERCRALDAAKDRSAVYVQKMHELYHEYLYTASVGMRPGPYLTEEMHIRAASTERTGLCDNLAHAEAAHECQELVAKPSRSITEATKLALFLDVVAGDQTVDGDGDVDFLTRLHQFSNGPTQYRMCITRPTATVLADPDDDRPCPRRQCICCRDSFELSGYGESSEEPVESRVPLLWQLFGHIAHLRYTINHGTRKYHQSVPADDAQFRLAFFKGRHNSLINARRVIDWFGPPMAANVYRDDPVRAGGGGQSPHADKAGSQWVPFFTSEHSMSQITYTHPRLRRVDLEVIRSICAGQNDGGGGCGMAWLWNSSAVFDLVGRELSAPCKSLFFMVKHANALLRVKAFARAPDQIQSRNGSGFATYALPLWDSVKPETTFRWAFQEPVKWRRELWSAIVGHCMVDMPASYLSLVSSYRPEISSQCFDDTLLCQVMETTFKYKMLERSAATALSERDTKATRHKEKSLAPPTSNAPLVIDEGWFSYSQDYGTSLVVRASKRSSKTARKNRNKRRRRKVKTTGDGYSFDNTCSSSSSSCCTNGNNSSSSSSSSSDSDTTEAVAQTLSECLFCFDTGSSVTKRLCCNTLRRQCVFWACDACAGVITTCPYNCTNE